MAAHVEETSGDQNDYQQQRENDQKVADVHHSPLEMGNTSGACDEFRCPSKKRVRPGGSYHGRHFALFNDRTRVCAVARFLADGQRFTSERRLIDADVIAGDYISIDQSALTGESLPVSKKSGEGAYSGSIVKQGEMTAVVIATGANTFFGRTAKLVAGAGSVSHFQRAVMHIGNFLIILALLLVVILVAARLFDMRGHYDRAVLLRLAEIVLILLVASVPVAMPAVLSVTMALGARMLAKRKAIVSRLEAIEELAGVDVLCSDKTGTLTRSKLTLGEAQPSAGTDADTLILMASLASRAADDDPIDLAILAGLKSQSVLSTYHQEAYIPFDPVQKRTEATIKDGSGAVFRVSKGAPQVILSLTKLAGADLVKARQ